MNRRPRTSPDLLRARMIGVQVTKAEFDLIRAAAEQDGVSVSALTRATLMGAIKSADDTHVTRRTLDKLIRLADICLADPEDYAPEWDEFMNILWKHLPAILWIARKG